MRGYYFQNASFVIPTASDEFGHSFGGPIRHEGASPDGAGPLHLLYNLNLSDPRLGRKLKNSAWLPLYHPLAFDGGRLSYRVISETRIEILDLRPHEYHLGWQYPEMTLSRDNVWVKDGPDYPEFFPQMPVKMESISYEDHKALLFRTVYLGARQPEPGGTERKNEFVRIGGYFPHQRSEGYLTCPNSECRQQKTPAVMEPITVIGNEPTPGCFLFSPNGSDVKVAFRICPHCEAIFTYNFSG